MRVVFEMSSKNSDKAIAEDELVLYDPSSEVEIDGNVESNHHIIPMMRVHEESNVYEIGYCEETSTLVIRYKEVMYSVEGFSLGEDAQPFGYFYHDVPKLVFSALAGSSKKSDFINNRIKQRYAFHREPIGLDLVQLTKRDEI